MPDLKITPITPSGAKDIIIGHAHIPPKEDFDFAIAVFDDEKCAGVIGMYANGEECRLGHLWTSGEPLVGSILYGAAWRCAKSLGYETIGL